MVPLSVYNVMAGQTGKLIAGLRGCRFVPFSVISFFSTTAFAKFPLSMIGRMYCPCTVLKSPAYVILLLRTVNDGLKTVLKKIKFILPSNVVVPATAVPVITFSSAVKDDVAPAAFPPWRVY